MTVFEKQLLRKLKMVLKLLEDTANTEDNFKVIVRNFKNEDLHITHGRENFLEVNIESSIIGLKDVIQTVEQREKVKRSLYVIASNDK